MFILIHSFFIDILVSVPVYIILCSAMHDSLVNFRDAFCPCDTHPSEMRRFVSMKSLRCECQKCVFVTDGTDVAPKVCIQLRRYMYNVVVDPHDVPRLFPGADASAVRPYTSNGHTVLHIYRRPSSNQAPSRLERDIRCHGVGCNYYVLDAKYTFCSIECLLDPTPTPAPSPAPSPESRVFFFPNPSALRLARRKVRPCRSYFE